MTNSSSRQTAWKRPLRRVSQRLFSNNKQSYGSITRNGESSPLVDRPEEDDDEDFPRNNNNNDDNTAGSLVVPHASPEIRVEHPSRRLMRHAIVACMQVFLAALFYLIGVHRPEYASVAMKLAEYSLVALFTCIALYFLLDTQYKPSSQPIVPVRCAAPLPQRSKPLSAGWDLEAASRSNNRSRAMSLPTLVSYDEDASPRQDKTTFQPTVLHPALEPFYIIDTQTKQRIQCNGSPYQFSTDYFSGTVLVLIRPPDVDTSQDKVAVYLRPKQRRFEFQFQIRLHKVPSPGQRLYFACSLAQPITLGVIQRAFVGASMAFCKSSNPTFHYNVTGNSEELPHMAFPVEQGMNRVVATAPEQVPPTLGGAIEESDESVHRRKKGGTVNWNTSDTYTLSLWSAYVDFLDWKVLNLPGIRPFALSRVIGTQPIYLTLYEVPENAEKHSTDSIRMICQFEMCNSLVSGVGQYTHEYLCDSGQQEPRHAHFLESTDEIMDVPREKSSFLDQEEAVAELGQGMYVRSGDCLTLRQVENDESMMTQAAGFCVLHEAKTTEYRIVIEKAGGGRSSKSHQSDLIKSGDTIQLKLIRGDETRYLSIHRQWWLKWVTTPPSKNGFFTITTHETEYEQSGGPPRGVSETQSLYLIYGGSFVLRHKRWSKFCVGVAAEESATFGGRMLGLYLPKGDTGGIGAPSGTTDLAEEEGEIEQLEGTGKREWMRPLQLRAYECSDASNLSFGGAIRSASEIQIDKCDDKDEICFCREGYSMDAPAWLEILNRTDRTRQLTHAIRVTPPESIEGDKSIAPRSFVCLRTGMGISKIMRVGTNWRNMSVSLRRASLVADKSLPNLRQRSFSDSPRNNRASISSPMLSESVTYDEYHGPQSNQLYGVEGEDVGYDMSSDSDWDAESLGYAEMGDEVDVVDAFATPKSGKGRHLIGKLAKSVKTTTSSTGRTVMRQSVKIGKGTVSAGKSMIPRRKRNPPQKEPKRKTPAKKSNKRLEKDLHVAVNRSMRRIERVKSRQVESPTVLAGQLSAPEQSCRAVSKMLSHMSGVPRSSPLSPDFSSLMYTLVESQTHLDSWFLHGGATELGVVPISNDFIVECIVARCLWESHWREEWCAVYANNLVIYEPLSTAPCLELSFEDIECIRTLDESACHPLPGFPILVVETAWLCHYLAFNSEELLNEFYLKLEEAQAKFTEGLAQSTTLRNQELWQARFWQGFQNSVESSISSSRRKWAEVPSGNKMKPRTIFNNRRMIFDLDPAVLVGPDFVESLLKMSTSFTLESLKGNPKAFVTFLDSVSYLRMMQLSQIGRDGPEAFCMFVNLYHCLLQHALLLCVNGPLNKRSCGHFMRTSCYEIGGDIFSLAELNSCVIRGQMSRPLSSKAPYVEASKKSSSYRFYALGYTTPRVNFILNTADFSCPPVVSVFNIENMEEQLNVATTEFIKRNISVDMARKTVYIPKVCDIYRNDFSSETNAAASACLRYCLVFLDGPVAARINQLLRDESSLIIKFQPVADEYHGSLRLRSAEELTDIEV